MCTCPALRCTDSKPHKEASVLISQPSDPLKKKELLVQKLVCDILLCESHSPHKTKIKKGKLAMLLGLIFLLLFFHSFLLLLCKLKCFEFSGVSAEFKWLFKGVSPSKDISCLCTVRTLSSRSRNNSIFNLVDYLHHGEREMFVLIGSDRFQTLT